MTNLTIGDDLLASLSIESREQLRTYRDLILHWNQRFNLTALESEEAVDQRLIGDALRLLPTIDVVLTRRPDGRRLVDLGTGAGLPGVAIKIARPDLDVTLIDATQKKVHFVQHVIDELGLTGTHTIHGRAEDIGRMMDYRQQYAIGTARAVAALPTLLELLLPLIEPGGTFLLPKGEAIAEELAAGRRAAGMLGGRILDATLLPECAGAPVTRLVTGVKLRSTSDRYPRRAGIPNREPLGRDSP
ncbi:MAG TPA: 16S rRNA (guanine(527)-N(7))-methyltransferase RsmG [Thermomicrobiales bacterium]|nr:16S rRNA (guanine(527)-N(7))-methyltransferase RsmG [Thermomicrobiales bacterium]HRA47496.1 16S rRNA (guanine(527)-N(7))-methyltransferase RsmG [Thermomicrobiales bacterium]